MQPYSQTTSAINQNWASSALTLQQFTLTSSEFPRTIIIEHMEPYLFQWCLAEYKQMKQYLQNYNVRLVISNGQSFIDFKGEQIYEKENQIFVNRLFQCFKQHDVQGEQTEARNLKRNYKQNGKYVVLKESVTEICDRLRQPVCMLDMRGQKELSPDEDWTTLVFGGILGGHPPRDRPEPVRKHFNNIRHLGQLQLATDTAVLITRLILDNKMPLQKIPMIKQPTIKGLNIHGQKTSVQMQGFSYVSKELDLQSGKMIQGLSKKDKKDIYMSDKVKQLLLRDDLDQNLIM